MQASRGRPLARPSAECVLDGLGFAEWSACWGAFVTGSHHMQLFNPIHKAELISIVEEASAKAAKNARVVQELVFPHIYFVLSKRLSVVDGHRLLRRPKILLCWLLSLRQKKRFRIACR